MLPAWLLRSGTCIAYSRKKELTNLGPQCFELSFLWPPLRPLVNNNTCGIRLRTGSTLRPYPITSCLSSPTLLASKSWLLTKASCHDLLCPSMYVWEGV